MDNIIKSDSQNQSLNQFLFVSDSQLIIDVLFNSPFYGAYISYYKYPDSTGTILHPIFFLQRELVWKRINMKILKEFCMTFQ